jgi:hypothetical protein
MPTIPQLARIGLERLTELSVRFEPIPEDTWGCRFTQVPMSELASSFPGAPTLDDRMTRNLRMPGGFQPKSN